MVGAITDLYILLLSGVAELFAGTISMAFGAYQSAKYELEVWERESQREKVKEGRTPEEEREELITYYEKEGFKRGEAEASVEHLLQKLVEKNGVLYETLECGSPGET